MAIGSLPAEVTNAILGVLLLLPFLLVLIDTFFRTLFLAVGFSRKPIIPEIQSESPDPRILILVLAHNEQRVIVRTLNLIQLEIAGDSSVTLAMVADNCTDNTVELATQAGVKVFNRSDCDGGKGRALSWFATNYQSKLDAYDLIAIFDADTMISVGFCQNLRLAFHSTGTQVVQSFVEPVTVNGLPLATLAAYSEILSQRIDDEARSRLGWASPLRGTGMVFRRAIFLSACSGLQTQVDDIELSLRLTELKIPVVYWQQLKIFDPKSASILGLAKQRGRWLRGQRDIWRSWFRKFKALSGLSEWSLFHAMLLKPKAALYVIKAILLCIFCFLDTNFFVFPKVLVLLSLFVDFFYYLTGLLHVSNPYKYMFSFLSAPLFFAMWIVSWFYSLGRQKEWLRARE